MENFKNEFTIIASYRNTAEKNIEFSINAEEPAIGYSVTAIETDKGKGKCIGYHFNVYLGTLNESIWKIRKKNKKELGN